LELDEAESGLDFLVVIADDWSGFAVRHEFAKALNIAATPIAAASTLARDFR
jgi:hypothetical protein